MAVKKKQVSIEVIEYIQRTINELLESKMEQISKRKLCFMMEKLLKDTKQKEDDYQYLYWNKFGKLDWAAEKDQHLTKLSVGATIKIPQEYITGPDYDGSDSFMDSVQGEWSRQYY